MRISLNLATRPYLELRPVLARLRVAAVILFVLALPMLLVIRVAETRAQLAEAKVDQLRSNIALLRREEANARALTRQGENAQVLGQAAFLNELFRRKSFSWTAAMSDLETTMPGGVQVQAIDPVISPNGQITLRLRVTGGREQAVQLVHNLERSRYFAAARLVAEALNTQNSGQGQPGLTSASNPTDVTFDILADYRSLPNTHPTSPGGRGRSKPAPEVAEAPQAQLTNPEPTPLPAPLPRPTPKSMYHSAPAMVNSGPPPIPPPLGERP